MTIREAVLGDAEAIIALINELAKYEKLENEVNIDIDIFKRHIFERKFANVLVAENNGKIVGYALFFHTFSTFLGRAGIYLEDLYVKPEFRGLGLGIGFIKELAKICKDEGFGRLEWECLEWNEPSIKFYESLGAKRQSGWLKFRMTKDEFKKLS